MSQEVAMALIDVDCADEQGYSFRAAAPHGRGERPTIMPEDLAAFLRRKVEQSSYRAVEAETGISRGSLEQIINRRNKGAPELPTLLKIKRAYKLQLSDVLRMAGVDEADIDDVISPSARQMHELEVLREIAEHFDLPLTDVLMRAGIVGEVEISERELNDRVTSFSRRHPEWSLLLLHLMAEKHRMLLPVLMYLEHWERSQES